MLANSVLYFLHMTNIFNVFGRAGASSTLTTPSSVASPAVPLVNDSAADRLSRAVAIARPTAGSVALAATAQVSDAIAHNRQYTLTIGEAQQLFVKCLRQPLSERSLQRYCQAGAIAAELVTHSQGKEWLINEPSLLRFIERRPITVADNSATPTRSIARQDDSDAADDYVKASEIGEPRRLADLLIENARLLALLEGKTELVGTLKSHEAQVRDDLKDANQLVRELTGDVKHIASQMLQTMERIGTAGRTPARLSHRTDEQPND